MPKAKATRRLPYPGCSPDPLGSVKKRDVDAIAIDYLRWICARDGVEIPDRCSYGESISISFCSENGAGYAYVTRRIPERRDRHKKRSKVIPEQIVTEAKIPVPAWGMPCCRVDLWHAAHQAGADLETCYSIANYYNTRSEDYKQICEAATGEPAQFGLFLQARAQRLERERIEREARSAEASCHWFDENCATRVKQEGFDGALAFGDWACQRVAARTLRRDWMLSARHAKDYGLDVGQIRLCVERARLFHQHLLDMQKDQRKAA